MPLYFAYGANMDRNAMAVRCPASRPLGVARLAKHRVVIMRQGYASILRDPRRRVWGLLWDLALADLPALDRFEGVGGGLYTKIHQPVVTAAGMRRALVYVGRDAGPGIPRPGYLEAVLAAGRSLELPAEYLRDLALLAPRLAASEAAGPTTRPRPAVTPLRRSPLDAEPPRQPSGWRWTP